ncbi:hypothetical protein [Plebeiibacterium marinum]|uniref:Uncharacterized protein n=1 Tax=Plebeiibacterium marinum TaxID=2992111 RepID=A0AAE3ME51_9BACT|nr:hypothetical protein [Plebeiobacterium marinum]MCW3806186.1 hypothetical protein [Plebeiobacterium marinum]
MRNKIILIATMAIIIILTLRYCNTSQESIQSSQETSISLTDYKQYIDSVKPATQNFTIAPGKDNYITGKKGTVVYFPALSLDVKSTDSVQIQLKEYTTKREFYVSNMTTTSNGALLESNGMVDIRCYSNNKEIGLKKGAKAAIAFPKKDKSDDFKLFYGGNSVNGINWLLQNDENLTKLEKRIKENVCTYTYSIPQTNCYKLSWFKDGERLGLNSILSAYYAPSFELVDYLTSNPDKFLAFNFDLNTETGKIINVKDYPGNPTNKYSAEIIKAINNLPPSTLIPTSAPMISLSKEHYELSVRLKKEVKQKVESGTYKPATKSYTLSFSKEAFEKYSLNTNRLYNYTISKLGIINCDKFISKDKKIPFTVPISGNGNTNAKLIFYDINSMITGKYWESTFNFGDIPEQKKVLLLIEQDMADKKIILYDSFNITDTIYNINNLKPVSIHQLDSILLNI